MQEYDISLLVHKISIFRLSYNIIRNQSHIEREGITLEKIRDIMTDRVECCTLLDNIFEVAVKMKNLNVGAIPIVDQERLVGMITDRDIVIRGVAEKNLVRQKWKIL